MAYRMRCSATSTRATAPRCNWRWTRAATARHDCPPAAPGAWRCTSPSNRRGLRGGSIGAGRPAGPASRDRRRALQPGGQPAQRRSPGAGRGGHGPVDVPAGIAITLKDGVVEQSNFGDFTVARITDMPAFDVHICPAPSHHRHGRARPAAAGARLRQRHRAADREAAAPAAVPWRDPGQT